MGKRKELAHYRNGEERVENRYRQDTHHRNHISYLASSKCFDFQTTRSSRYHPKHQRQCDSEKPWSQKIEDQCEQRDFKFVMLTG